MNENNNGEVMQTSQVQENLNIECDDQIYKDCAQCTIDVNGESGSALNKPRIVICDVKGNMYLDQHVEEGLWALCAWNYPPKIFSKGGSLVTIEKDQEFGHKIDTVQKPYLKYLLSQTAEWVAEEESKNGIKYVSRYPNDAIVAAILEANRDWMGIPELKGLTGTPIPREDGTINLHGYDEKTRYYFTPGLEVPDLPLHPTQEDAVKAAQYLYEELFQDFPLKDDASGANMMAALITPVLRPLYDDITPLFVITKPEPGEGAGLLADVVSLISTGMIAPTQDANCFVKDNTETRKNLTSLLRAGSIITVLDNLDQNSTFDSPVMAMFLTAKRYQDRLLGHSITLNLTNNVCLFLTGRNVKIGGDIPRRTVLIEMESLGTELLHNPDKRNFKHPDLVKWIEENRTDLVVAIFTMIRAWAIAGKPAKVPIIGRFEKWCLTIGGILEYAGINGFLGNQEIIWDEMDSERDEWHDFAQLLYFIKKSEHLSAKELLALIRGANNGLRDVLPVKMEESLKKGAQSLGKSLMSNRNVALGGFVIKTAKNAHTNTSEYWIDLE